MAAPALLRRLVGWLLPATHREDILNDLDEDYTRRPRYQGVWYLAQALHLSVTRPWRQHTLHHQRGRFMWSTFWQDIRFSARTLRKAPGFTAVAVMSLAIGIGLNGTIFAVVDNLLFRPLPYADADRVVAIYTSDERGERFGSSSYPDLRDLSAASTLEALVGHSMMFAAVSINGDNRLRLGEVVTSNYFSALGIPIAQGAGFRPEHELTEDGSPVVVISHHLWQHDFGGSPNVLGQTLRIKNKPYTIVGVAGDTFSGSMPGVTADLWIPATMVGDVEPAGQNESVPSATGTTRFQQRGNRWLFLKGRLKAGISVDAASANLAAISRELASQHPVSNRSRTVSAVPVESIRFHPEIDAVVRPAGAVLLVAVGLVLLVACANLAGMLLARGAARTKEFALRSAIGASRGRLVRQMTVESLLLSLCGGVLGLLLAYWGTSRLVAARLPIDIPIAFNIPIDWRLIAFTLLLSLLTTLLFGLIPALRASRPNLVTSLKDDASLSTGGRAFGLRHALVIVQVAVAVVLLVGGALLTRSLFAGFNTNPGFTLNGAVTATLSLDMHGYDDVRARRFFDDAVERVRRLPGVTHVALAERMPMSPNIHTTTLVVDGRPEATPTNGASVDTSRVTDGYFDTMGVRIIEGRGFGTEDTPDTPRVAVVSQAFAKAYFPNGDAIGHQVRLRDQAGPVVRIVGISADYAVRSVGEPARPMIHFAASQRRSTAYSMVARTAADTGALAAGIERELRAMEPDLVFLELTPLTRMAAASMLPISIGASLFGGLAALAMLLSGLGLYGVIAFSVARRTREIGIRMALGSSRGAVVSRVMREAAVLVGVGIVVGGTLAAVASQALSSVVLGVTTLDPISYLAACVGLATVAVVAAVVPARRAASVDPLLALRAQ